MLRHTHCLYCPHCCWCLPVKCSFWMRNIICFTDWNLIYGLSDQKPGSGLSKCAKQNWNLLKTGLKPGNSCFKHTFLQDINCFSAILRPKFACFCLFLKHLGWNQFLNISPCLELLWETNVCNIQADICGFIKQKQEYKGLKELNQAETRFSPLNAANEIENMSWQKAHVYCKINN